MKLISDEEIPYLVEVIRGNITNNHQKMARILCPECKQERLVRYQSILQNIKRNKYTGLCSKCSYKHRIDKLMKSTPRRNQNGYVRVYIPINDFFAPMLTKAGRVLEHRLIMAKHLGRCLQSWEIVHHKNGIKIDNRIENLELTTNGQHHIDHNKSYKDGYVKGLQDGKNEQIKRLKADLEDQQAERDESAEFWREIIYKDGKLDEEQVLKELADFYFIMEQIPSIYYAITGGKLSKPMYSKETIISAFEDYLQDLLEDARKEWEVDLQAERERTVEEIEKIGAYLPYNQWQSLKSKILEGR